MKKCLKLKIFGKVQGVFFRVSAEKKANELGVFGWVRNRTDGSVEILAEGEGKVLGEFLQWCRKGPDKAQVSRVEVEHLEESNGFKRFEIKR